MRDLCSAFVISYELISIDSNGLAYRSPSWSDLSFGIEMHQNLVSPVLRLYFGLRRAVTWAWYTRLRSAIFRASRNARSLPIIRSPTPFVWHSPVRHVRPSPSHAELGSPLSPPHLWHLAFPLFLFSWSTSHGHLLQIMLCLTRSGGCNLVCALAVETSGDTATLVDTFDGLRVIGVVAVSLAALVVEWRWPSGRKSRWFRLLRNYQSGR